MGSGRAAMAFLDVPYFLDVPHNVWVQDVVGRGHTKHAEFAFASGEMSRPEGFLEAPLGAFCRRLIKLLASQPRSSIVCWRGQSFPRPSAK